MTVITMPVMVATGNLCDGYVNNVLYQVQPFLGSDNRRMALGFNYSKEGEQSLGGYELLPLPRHQVLVQAWRALRILEHARYFDRKTCEASFHVVVQKLPRNQGFYITELADRLGAGRAETLQLIDSVRGSTPTHEQLYELIMKLLMVGVEVDTIELRQEIEAHRIDAEGLYQYLSSQEEGEKVKRLIFGQGPRPKPEIEGFWNRVHHVLFGRHL
ncbi:MAG TPA: hypothetical protein VEC17_00810 [Candidatus Binatia bacterium]|nr:hypothetical protein [Candidatus Binatia bacterium]